MYTYCNICIFILVYKYITFFNPIPRQQVKTHFFYWFVNFNQRITNFHLENWNLNLVMEFQYSCETWALTVSAGKHGRWIPNIGTKFGVQVDPPLNTSVPRSVSLWKLRIAPARWHRWTRTKSPGWQTGAGGWRRFEKRHAFCCACGTASFARRRRF